ncbi:MAG: DUF2785 domain-containing protein [Deltaproteobacteria bacterium]|nr:DUF2785 domain-containing protein [Deltaproteobacteria bacterium]
MAASACGHAPRCPVATPSPAIEAAPSLAPPLAADRLAELRAARDAKVSDPAFAAAATDDVLVALTALDPAIRDGIGYELLSRWIVRDRVLEAPAVAAIRDRLVARLADPLAPADGVFARSFAALGLSLVAAREAAQAAWTDAELAAQVDAAVGYAGRETDYRGYTGATGWAHAAAHTADWIKFLGRHPRLTSAQAVQLLDAIAGVVARRHGHRFSHGEDERLAAAVLAIARRGLVDDAAIDAWIGKVVAQILVGWPEPFDPVLFAAQRNARDLIVSAFVALSFDDAPPSAAVLARLRAAMRAT